MKTSLNKGNNSAQTKEFYRIISTTLAILFLFSLFAPASSVFADEELTFIVGSTVKDAGETFQIPITISANPGIAILRLEITLDNDLDWDYDPLTYSSSVSTWPFVVGDVLPISGRPQGANLTESFASILFMDEGSNSYEDDLLVTLKLKVKDTATSGNKSIIINIDTCVNEDDQDVFYNPVEPGIVEVLAIPIINTTSLEYGIGETVTGRLTASGGSISWSKISGPTWLNIASDGGLSGTAPGAVETVTLKVTATNAKGSDTQDIAVNVVVLPPVQISFMGVSGGNVSKVYGDSAFTEAATVTVPAVYSASVTYTSNDTAVATVDALTGAVTIVGQGTAVIAATAEAIPGAYTQGTASYTLNVAKKSLSIISATATKQFDASTGVTVTEWALTGYAAGDNASSVTVDTYTAEYSNVKAGTTTINVSAMALTGVNSGNYEVTVPATNISVTGGGITKKDISINTVTALIKDFDGSSAGTAGTVTFVGEVTGYELMLGTDYSVSVVYSSDYNAGSGKSYTYTVTMLGTETAGNYNLAVNSKSGTDGVITQIAYTGTKAGASAAKYGTTGMLDLATLGLPSLGLAFGTASVQTDTSSILDGMPSINGTVLSYVLVDSDTNVGATAVIRIPVTCTNYTGFDVDITVTMLDKLAQDGFKFAVSAKTVTYGDGSFTETPTGEEEDSIVADWDSSDTSVATVDTAGEVTILAVGTTTISAIASETDDYAATMASYALTVGPKTVNVTAGSYMISKAYDGSTGAGAATGALSVSGILSGDDAEVDEGTIPEYTSANVHSGTLALPISLSGTDVGNYTLDGVTTVNVPASITPKPLSSGPSVTITGTYTYTGSAITPTYTVMDGATALTISDYNAVLTNNTNAGTATLTVSAAANGNYAWSPAVVETFSIAKIAYPGTKTAAASAKYGASGVFDLATMLPAGYVLGTPVVDSDPSSVLAGAPAVSGTALQFAFVGDKAKVGGVAEIRIPVTASTNYEPYDIVVTVTVTDKLAQSGFGFAESIVTKTYGDTDFTLAATGQTTGSIVTYISSDPSVVAVDALSGQISILKAGGPVTITAQASETEDYDAASATYTLTVNKAALTVKPKDISIRRNNAMPEPSVEYVGLKGSDDGEAVAVLSGGSLDMEIRNADDTDELENTATVGVYKIIFNDNPVFDPTDNYTISIADGTLTITQVSNPEPEIDNPVTPPTGGTTGGTSGGGGGGAMMTVPTGDGTVSIDAIQAGTAVTLLIPDAKISEIAGKAVDKKAVIDLSKLVGTTSASVPKAAIAQLAGAGVSTEFKMPQGTLTLDTAAAQSVAAQAEGANVSLSLTLLKVSDLPVVLRSAVRGSDVIFDIGILSGTQAITGFSGTISIRVPYEGPLPAAVWHLGENGILERLPCEYDAATKTLSFSTNHLSLYVVGQGSGTWLRLAIGELNYAVNDTIKKLDSAPVIVGDRTMVPLRFIAEALGAKVDWNSDTQTASVALDGKTLSVTIGEPAAGMDVPAMIIQDRTMVPLRFISEALGCDVDWNDAARSVTISK